MRREAGLAEQRGEVRQGRGRHLPVVEHPHDQLGGGLAGAPGDSRRRDEPLQIEPRGDNGLARRALAQHPRLTGRPSIGEQRPVGGLPGGLGGRRAPPPAVRADREHDDDGQEQRQGDASENPPHLREAGGLGLLGVLGCVFGCGPGRAPGALGAPGRVASCARGPAGRSSGRTSTRSPRTGTRRPAGRSCPGRPTRRGRARSRTRRRRARGRRGCGADACSTSSSCGAPRGASVGRLVSSALPAP